MLILGIETSCDETAAAVVADGRRVLSNAIASQVELHQRFGGVVPEVASRAHTEQILPIVELALSEAETSLSQIDAIAVTRGPGLIGCLLIGVEFAKSLSETLGVPLIGVHHVAGHVDSPNIGRESDAWGHATSGAAPDPFPYVALAISGGHSSMVLAREPGIIEPLGETLDDAVGEAYDKIAKLIGLGYPGGPIVDRLAAQGDPNAFKLPRPLLNRDGFDFSFSGLKTAFAREVEKLGDRIPKENADQSPVVHDLCASFQAAAVDVLIGKAQRALDHTRTERIAFVGGVACNRGLRSATAERLSYIHVAFPAPEFCTDNAAMIAGLGCSVIGRGLQSSLAMNATAQLELTAPADRWQ